MLGSHDTFTYLKTNNILAKTFTLWWRCQEHTIQEQYKMGVRVFDLRVIHESSDGFNWWRIGHGFATLEQRFVNLTNICTFFKKEFPGSILRICLESGCDNEEIVNRFKKESEKVVKRYSTMLWCIVIKKPWQTLYTFKSFKKIVEPYCHLFNWNTEKDIMYNLKQFDISAWNLKTWAKSHNPEEITQEMIDDPDTLYFLDYIGTYPQINNYETT